MRMRQLIRRTAWALSVGAILLTPSEQPAAAEDDGPEAAIRAMVRANADKDMAALSRLMAHDSDIISYTIGGENMSAGPISSAICSRSSARPPNLNFRSGN